MRRALIVATTVVLAACATSRDRTTATATRVRLTTWPESTHVSVSCGASRFAGMAPLDFEFPPGPDARCTAEFTSQHYQELHVDIDRQYLFDHGEISNRHADVPAPRVYPFYGPPSTWAAIVLSIEAGIEQLVNAAHRVAAATRPDITVKVSLQPEAAS